VRDIAAFLVFALAVCCGASAQTVVRTADPIERGLTESDFPRKIKVTDNVYTYEDFHAGDEKFTTTNMFVVTDEGVVVCDGQGSVAATKSLVAAIAAITPKPIKYVVVASDHGDHTAGNASFPAGVTYIIHPNSKAILNRAATGWKPPQQNAELVEHRKMIMIGGEPIGILFLGRAHTGGDLAVYLPRHKILFLSEIFLNRVFPAMRSAYPSEWLKALAAAEEINADIYVPGHGFTESGPVSREELVAYHQALRAVIEEATRLYKAGVPVDDAVRQARWGEYGSWTLASSQGPIAVRKVYQELSGGLR
jgi:glyoxylase-like metal-dependent hydrolase (beta-lactamase superfamily II)